MTAASVFLESPLVVTAPKAEKESVASALKGIGVLLGSSSSSSSGNPPILKQAESPTKRPPGGRGVRAEDVSQKNTITTDFDFDRCLAGYFGLVKVAVDASALTPCGFAAVISTSTLCLGSVP